MDAGTKAALAGIGMLAVLLLLGWFEYRRICRADEAKRRNDGATR